MTQTPETVRGNAAPKITDAGRVWDDEQARQRIASPGRYTPLVPRPEGGAVLIMDPRIPASTDATSIYRYFDQSGVLLYVGITSRGATRNVEHNRSKSWWQYVTRQEVEHVATRDDAEQIERELIRAYQPPFNTQHNRAHQEARQAYEAHAQAGQPINMRKVARTLPRRCDLRLLRIESDERSGDKAVYVTPPTVAPIVQHISERPKKVSFRGPAPGRILWVHQEENHLRIGLIGRDLDLPRISRATAHFKLLDQKACVFTLKSIEVSY